MPLAKCPLKRSSLPLRKKKEGATMRLRITREKVAENERVAVIENDQGKGIEMTMTMKEGVLISLKETEIGTEIEKEIETVIGIENVRDPARGIVIVTGTETVTMTIETGSASTRMIGTKTDAR